MPRYNKHGSSSDVSLERFLKIRDERDTLRDERDTLKRERDTLQGQIDVLKVEKGDLKRQVLEERAQADKFENAFKSLERKISNMNLFEVSEDGKTKIGSLSFSENDIIATGRNNSVIYPCTYQNRSAAVKRIPYDGHPANVDEYLYLAAYDNHPNIIRCHGMESDLKHIYICIERCLCNLEDFIRFCKMKETSRQPLILTDHLHVSINKAVGESKLWINNNPSPFLVQLLREILLGIAHLHQHGVAHRDIQPHNVLISNESPLTAKVSDMGESLNITGKPSKKSSAKASHGSGETTEFASNVGWRAKEMIQGKVGTCAVDMFSYGNVLYFSITKGDNHPFGNYKDIREENVRKGLFNLDKVNKMYEARDLISNFVEIKSC